MRTACVALPFDRFRHARSRRFRSWRRLVLRGTLAAAGDDPVTEQLIQPGFRSPIYCHVPYDLGQDCGNSDARLYDNRTITGWAGSFNTQLGTVSDLRDCSYSHCCIFPHPRDADGTPPGIALEGPHLAEKDCLPEPATGGMMPTQVTRYAKVNG